jgi:hypothetical protein
MSRLLSTLTLLALLLLAAAPASGVMVRGEKTAVPDFFGSSLESAFGDEWPATPYRTRGGVDCSYETALDVRDGPNLYAYVQQNPWTKFDPDGLEAQPAPGGGFMFVSNQEPNSYVGHQVQHPNTNYSGQCAVGAQYVCGTVTKDGKLHDAPSTKQPSEGGPWRRGPSLKDGFVPPRGTMIASGWVKDENGIYRYPSAETGNHTALYVEATDKKGNFVAISQNRRTEDPEKKGRSPFSRDIENVETADWHVVVADSRFDPAQTKSSLLKIDNPNYPDLDKIQSPRATQSPTDSAKTKPLVQMLKSLFNKKKKG